jgi:cyclic pyranopterin phosphate synthase
LSALKRDAVDWNALDVESYFEFARARGATRLVITGGGEPLLRGDDVCSLVRRGRPFFNEIACFTNGTYLAAERARELSSAGLSYLCYSRHHYDDERCRELMGNGTPTLDAFFRAVGKIKVRATCVMARGYVDSEREISEYVNRLSDYGVGEFTFKHTYVAYEQSVFGNSSQNSWARDHKIEFDPFAGQGRVVSLLPWGPAIRNIRGRQICYYYEPTPTWEKENRLCRSSNLMSDGKVFASLEDQSSLLCQLKSC